MRAYRSRQLRQDVEQAPARAYWAELRRWMRTMAESVMALADARRHNGDGDEPLPHSIYFADLTRRAPEAFLSLSTPFRGALLAV